MAELSPTRKYICEMNDKCKSSQSYYTLSACFTPYNNKKINEVNLFHLPTEKSNSPNGFKRSVSVMKTREEDFKTRVKVSSKALASFIHLVQENHELFLNSLDRLDLASKKIDYYRMKSLDAMSSSNLDTHTFLKSAVKIETYQTEYLTALEKAGLSWHKVLCLLRSFPTENIKSEDIFQLATSNKTHFCQESIERTTLFENIRKENESLLFFLQKDIKTIPCISSSEYNEKTNHNTNVKDGTDIMEYTVEDDDSCEADYNAENDEDDEESNGCDEFDQAKSV